MGLLEKIKEAEHAGQKGWNDIEARIRQRWRIYPNRKVQPAPLQENHETAASTDEVECDELRPINPGDILEMMARADLSPRGASQEGAATTQDSNPEVNNEDRKPIVSINGKDVEEGELDERQSKDKNAA
jgi:hypothetical protein